MTSDPSGDLAHWHGEPVTTLEALLGVPRFEAWTELPSTNDRVRHLAGEGAAAWTVVVADRQTAGRGRGGTAWDSPPGVGLWVSVLLRPPSPPAGALVSLLTGLALARSVEAEVGVPAGLKWPNDLWVGGRKAAGILCEGDASALAVGIGINVRQRPQDFPEEFRARAISLESAAERPVSDVALLRRLVHELRRLADRPALRLDEELRAEWGRRDVLLGRRVRVGGIVGRAAGLDPSGHLVLDTDAGISRSVAAGHVEFVQHRARGSGGE